MALPDVQAVAVVAEAVANEAPWWWMWATGAMGAVGAAVWWGLKWAMQQLAEQRTQFTAYLEADAKRREKAVEVQTQMVASLQAMHSAVSHTAERVEDVHRAVVR